MPTLVKKPESTTCLLWCADQADAAFGVGTFFFPTFRVGGTTTEANVSVIVPYACRLRNLRARGKQGATGTTRVVARLDGVDTALDTGAVAGTAADQNIENTADTVSAAAGQLFTIAVVFATVGGTVHTGVVEVVRA